MFYALFLTFDILAIKQVLFAGGIGIIYAITDEIHQLYVPGRSGKVEDVFIDSIGVWIGICVLLFLIKIVEIIKK